jgi:protein-tyrosine phosphatase
MLRSFDPAVADKDPLEQGIEDPWYGGHTDFDTTWNLILASVPGIVKYVRAEIRQRDRANNTGQGNTGQRVRSIS